jgi:sugar phosphate isomerase/epimerase
VVRINEDPVEKILRYRDRLYDIHLKDVNEASADGESVEFGRGVVDLPFILQALAEINYTGVMAIEFEKDAKDPVPGLAESVGYSRGLLASMRI